MNILSLDLGSRTGYSIFNLSDGGYFPLDYGFVDLVPGSSSSQRSQSAKKQSGSGIQAYDPRPRAFSKLLQVLASKFSPDIISFEDVEFAKSLEQAHNWGSYRGAMWATFGETVRWMTFPVGTIKKFATGRGDAEKDQMLASLWDLGFTTNDDNEADALWIGILTAESVLSGRLSTPTNSAENKKSGKLKSRKSSLEELSQSLSLPRGLLSASPAEKSSKEELESAIAEKKTSTRTPSMSWPGLMTCAAGTPA